MADEHGQNDYYDIIREKITDPEIQKALDAFHARGLEAQRKADQPGAAALPSRDGGSVPPAAETIIPGGVRPQAPSGGYPQEPASRPPEPMTRPQEPAIRPQDRPARPSDIPPTVSRGGQPAPGTRDPAVFRRYMREPTRPSVYSDSQSNDAYEAAYREAMRKAAGERTSEERGRSAGTVVGMLVILFAVFGLGCAVFFGIKGVSSVRAKREEALFAAYNSRLICVAAVDPDAFEDVSAASMPDLIRIAVWSMIGSGFDPNRYVYANGELCLPQADVEEAYTSLFGAQLPIVHQTAEGYGYTVQYSADDAAYYIPMTTLEPIYTPKVTAVETRSGATVVTCGMISSGMWKQDSVTGNIVPPDPDKYIRVTFRTANGAEYISSIQSLGLPETAMPSGGASSAPGEPPAAEPTLPPVETTTEKKIVITWD